MKVLFLQHVINVGKEGEIKEVKPGYASNMLIPQWLAVELTPKVEKQYLEKKKREEKHKMELIENRHAIVETLQWKKLNFTVKTGENHKVYGGIGEKDIMRKIKKDYKLTLSKKHIDMPGGHLKKIGDSDIFIKLGKDAMAKITISLVEEK